MVELRRYSVKMEWWTGCGRRRRSRRCPRRCLALPVTAVTGGRRRQTTMKLRRASLCSLVHYGEGKNYEALWYCTRKRIGVKGGGEMLVPTRSRSICGRRRLARSGAQPELGFRGFSEKKGREGVRGLLGEVSVREGQENPNKPRGIDGISFGSVTNACKQILSWRLGTTAGPT